MTDNVWKKTESRKTDYFTFFYLCPSPVLHVCFTAFLFFYCFHLQNIRETKKIYDIKAERQNVRETKRI